MRYTINHFTVGGNCSYFPTLGDAIAYAINYASGFSLGSHGRIEERILDESGNWVATVFRRVHFCNCELCETNGAEFLHVRIF